MCGLEKPAGAVFIYICIYICIIDSTEGVSKMKLPDFSSNSPWTVNVYESELHNHVKVKSFSRQKHFFLQKTKLLQL